MKRLLCFLLSILMVLTLSSACAGSKTDNTTEVTQMKDIYQKSDPAQDDTLNILMIGNSLCYYYVEELYGMLAAAGIQANVCNVYYSGGTLAQHWNWSRTRFLFRLHWAEFVRILAKRNADAVSSMNRYPSSG